MNGLQSLRVLVIKPIVLLLFILSSGGIGSLAYAKFPIDGPQPDSSPFPPGEGILVPPPPLVLNENCVVSILNRTAQARPDGTWMVQNVPANFGQVRARATCVVDGITHSGQSDLFTVPQSGIITISDIHFDGLKLIPSSLTLSASTTTLTSAGPTTQLTVTATYPDGSTKNMSAASSGTKPDGRRMGHSGCLH